MPKIENQNSIGAHGSTGVGAAGTAQQRTNLSKKTASSSASVDGLDTVKPQASIKVNEEFDFGDWFNLEAPRWQSNVNQTTQQLTASQKPQAIQQSTEDAKQKGTAVKAPGRVAAVRSTISKGITNTVAVFSDPVTGKATSTGKAATVLATSALAGASAAAFVHGLPVIVGVGLAVAAGVGALFAIKWLASAIASQLRKSKANNEGALQEQAANNEAAKSVVETTETALQEQAANNEAAKPVVETTETALQEQAANNEAAKEEPTQAAKEAPKEESAQAAKEGTAANTGKDNFGFFGFGIRWKPSQW